MKTLKMMLVVAGLFLAAPLFAQRGVQSDIPFDFYVGNSQLMPSGTYQITPCAANVAVVRNCDSGVSVFHLTHPSGKEDKVRGKLVFHKYGDKYFLKEVRGPSLSTNLAIPETKNEKKARADMATVTTFETITVPNPDESAPPKQ